MDWQESSFKLYLRVFGFRAGCAVNLRINRVKFDPKAIEYIFISYPENVKGCKL